ncbi:MAG: acyl-CoA dehydrogenase family protein [Spirochaetales bacterium]|jgi:alkylation response protein AidB-like acyl-CoA dehydrogenase|nr:acyl-CoA dehydrogenase family protein [Spirochaetales bacterium]
MKNYFLDNPDIQFHLKHQDLDRMIRWHEDDFAEFPAYPQAPENEGDAREGYALVLSLVGELCARCLGPKAGEVDQQGTLLKDNEVIFPAPTQRAWELFAQAELLGFSLPRKYGGLHFPATILCMAQEMIARGDPSFLNFGLQQDIALAINKFASEEQKEDCLPRLARGEWDASMILTEPEAGSDLQAVSLRAVQDDRGQWRLNGVKRFITNGCGKLALVLARSEPEAPGGRGLSFFLYRREEGMTIRRLEHKMGIRGTATCELQFNQAPAELLGERKRGLTKYTIWLLNCARLGIAAQGIGIAEAAWREARTYAEKRIQFGRPIGEFPAVYEMLARMQVELEAGRSLLYTASRCVDLSEALESYLEKHPEQKPGLIDEKKKYGNYASFLTPLVKAYASEMANRAASAAVQVHGGSGYMKEFAVERLFRDARVTNIYEGTTQMQVAAALRGLLSGTAELLLDELDGGDYPHAPELPPKIRRARQIFQEAFALAKEKGDDRQFLSFHARRLSEMAGELIMAYLLLGDAHSGPDKLKIASLFIAGLEPRIRFLAELVKEEGEAFLENRLF